MHITQSGAGTCDYPVCTKPWSETGIKDYPGFCMQHVHRGWKKYLREFCFPEEQAQGLHRQRTKRRGYIVCAHLSVIGVFLLIFGPKDGSGVAPFVGGIPRASAVAVSWRGMVLRPTRASDRDLQRVFGSGENA